MSRYAISDIHGHAFTFEEALNRIGLNKQDELYLLGDYLNKGLYSKNVYDKIMQLKREGYCIHTLRGNHEDLALSGYLDSKSLASFGIKKADDLPEKYRNFMQSCFLILQTKDWIMVHGGIDFRQEKPLEPNNRMMWVRQWQHLIDYELLDGKHVLYGHTPNKRTNMLQQRENLNSDKMLCIDNGVFLPHQMGFGKMCVFNMDSHEFTFQDNIG